MNIASDRLRLIIGMGETGKSVATYLHAQRMAFMLADTRHNPPYLDSIKKSMPEVRMYLGDIPKSAMQMVDEVILSPGLPLSHPLVQMAVEMDKHIISDIELWRRSITKPVIAVSGSNGKSTVVSLLSMMAKSQGLNVASGGNLGRPVLDMDTQVDAYIIEVSSFQLDITSNLAADVACLLNVTPDHMDRYESFRDYYQSKQRIFNDCKAVVYNKNDKLSVPLNMPANTICFSGAQPDINEFGIIERGEGTYLAQGHKTLIDVKELKLLGSHNYQNILAALAVAKLQGWQLDKCLQVIKNFTGLEHRCQWIAEKQGVIYINDSKATNPAAACSSLLSMSEIYKGTIHIILGGSSKNAKFTELVDAIEKNEVSSYLIGEEGQTIYDALPSSVNKEICKDLPTAIKVISGKAQKGDVVLLSPACASFDSYASFSARGQHFIEEVQLI